MRTRTSFAAAGLVVAVALSLSGCALILPLEGAVSHHGAPTHRATPSATSVSPATGPVVTGTGYSVHAPKGWSAPPAAASRADIFIAGTAGDSTGYVDTINVLLTPDTGQTLAETEKSGAAKLVNAFAATDVTVDPRFAIAGTDSVHLSAHLVNNGFTGWAEQYILAHDGTIYTISFTFRQTVAPKDRESVAESVLATWTWS